MLRWSISFMRCINATPTALKSLSSYLGATWKRTQGITQAGNCSITSLPSFIIEGTNKKIRKKANFIYTLIEVQHLFNRKLLAA